MHEGILPARSLCVRAALQRRVWETAIPGPAKLIMLTLLGPFDVSAAELDVWTPSTRELAQLTGMRASTVIRYLALLEEHGWLVSRKQKGLLTEYDLHPGQEFTGAVRKLPVAQRLEPRRAGQVRRRDPLVYARDKWMCQMPKCLCPDGRAIDPAVLHPDPWSASIDHAQPLSRGGINRMGNKRAAHLRCNIVGFQEYATPDDYIAQVLAQHRREKWGGPGDVFGGTG